MYSELKLSEAKMIKTFLSLMGSVSVVCLVGCTTNFKGESIDYKSQGEKKTPSLSLPPDISVSNLEKRYSVADGTATLSQFNAIAGQAKKEDPKNTVTPAQAGMRIEKDGQRRWLVVNRPANDVYPKVRSFWEDTGFLLVTDSPGIGIMETDWAENRAKIPQGTIRRLLGGALDTIFSTGERDKFRTRLEKESNTQTEIYITHRGAEEKLVSMNQTQADSSMWTGRASDPELEAEMLARLMAYLGTSYEGAKSELSKSASTSAPRVSRVTDINDAAQLKINQGFDKTWREVGLALDRSNFTVEDRDRSQGIYFVRYVNTQDSNPKSKGGWLSNLFSASKEDDLKKAKRYRVVVKGDTVATTITAVEDTGSLIVGNVDAQILKIIDEQVSF